MFLTKFKGGYPLDLLHNIGYGIGRPHLNKSMDVLRLNGSFFYDPALFLALGFNDPATILCDLTDQNRLAAFWCPNKVKHQKMYPVFVPLIVCFFHVSTLP